ncbi:hypothetical protein L873DRAFT_1903174 [Choiromyces venosus 120613-1]|uniref:Uncharacterized protein n=1 Tax=Choiromyces venosus 120613-1 TaxID=1336337 RepID=A0A3N4JP63_9PEZI|nr:hypothetical protein L873DRAFT_1903174 [Choiromyces venosus 120613-1]
MIGLFLPFSQQLSLLLKLVELSLALTPTRASTLLNFAIQYLAFPPTPLNPYSVLQSLRLYAPSLLESLLPKQKKAPSIPTSPFSSR